MPGLLVPLTSYPDLSFVSTFSPPSRWRKLTRPIRRFFNRISDEIFILETIYKSNLINVDPCLTKYSLELKMVPIFPELGMECTEFAILEDRWVGEAVIFVGRDEIEKMEKKVEEEEEEWKWFEKVAGYAK